jgi:protein-disulfide isomerase
LYGAIAYFLVTAIALLGLLNGGPYLLASLFHLALLSIALLLATGYYAWALFFQLKILCVLCLMDYLVNLSIASVTFWSCWKVKPPMGAILAWDLRSCLGTRKGILQTTLMLILLVTLGLMVIRLEHWYYLFARDFHLVIEGKVSRIDTPWVQTFPTMGAEDAPIQVVSFGDYQCPYCGLMKMNWNEIMATYPRLIRMTAVEHPLNSDCNALAANNTTHALGCRAAYLALEVLDKKGEVPFWMIHDDLYRYGEELTPEMLTDMGKNYGLTQEEMDQVWQKSTSRNGLDKHLRIAQVLNFPGLPTSLLNGMQIQGYVKNWALLKMIEAELARKGLALKDYQVE